MHGLVNVKLMRRIDGRVGNLLCTALAAGKELSRPFAAPPGAVTDIVAITASADDTWLSRVAARAE